MMTRSLSVTFVIQPHINHATAMTFCLTSLIKIRNGTVKDALT